MPMVICDTCKAEYECSDEELTAGVCVFPWCSGTITEVV